MLQSDQKRSPWSLFSLFPNSERSQYIVQDDLLFWEKTDGLMKCWFGKREVCILSCSSKETGLQCPWEYMIQMCFNHSPTPKTLHCFCCDFELRNTKCTSLEGTFGKDYIFNYDEGKTKIENDFNIWRLRATKNTKLLSFKGDTIHTRLPLCVVGRCKTYIWYRQLGSDMHLCLLWKSV